MQRKSAHQWEKSGLWFPGWKQGWGGLVEVTLASGGGVVFIPHVCHIEVVFNVIKL